MSDQTLLDRPELKSRLAGALKEAPVVVSLGARQAGKTSLAQLFLQQQKTFRQVHVFDLERPQDRAALSAPELVLGGLKGLVIIDEVQRLPDLFTVLRPLARSLHQHLPGAEHSAAWHPCVGGGAAPLLGHARPLPRATVECLRSPAC